MATVQKTKNKNTKRIEAALKPEFPTAEAYQYNIASIRVRVIDDRFHGKSKPDREAMVLPLIEPLPEEVQADIMVLLLLSRDETEDSPMNLEFDHPSRSRL
jgi:stress-induced morphogen